MSVVTRELQMVYGSLTMGKGSEATHNVHGDPVLTFSRGAEAITATVSFDVIVKGTSAADFKTQCDLVQAEFLKPYLRFRWIYGTTTFIDWNPDDDSGFNAQPRCDKVGGPPDSARSRRYRCSVAVQLPADNNSGRISSDITVAYDKSDRRTVSFDVTYTAQGGTGALSNAQSKLPTFAASILSGLGGTYEILGTGRFVRDDQDKVCQASSEYREILYNQSSSGTDQTSVVDHTVTYALSEIGPANTPGGQFGTAVPLATITAAYVCNVDFGGTTDLAGLWAGTLRPYLISQARAIYSASILAVAENAPQFDKSANTISCTLRMTAVLKGSTVYAYSVTQTRRENPGARIVRVYDGNRFSGYVYEDPAIVERTTTIRAILKDIRGIQKVKGWKLAESEVQRDGRIPGPGTDGWVWLESTPTYAPGRIGIPGMGSFIKTTEYTQTIREQWIEKPKKGGGPAITHGGGGGAIGARGGAVTI